MERTDDRLRRGAVADGIRGAAANPSPAARWLARAAATAWLDRVSADIDLEIRERSVRLELPPEGFEAAVADEPDPVERAKIASRWERAESDLHVAREERLRAREAGASEVGPDGLVALSAVLEPSAPSEFARDLERGAIEPLDAAVREALRARRAAARVRLHGGASPADTPVFSALACHRHTLPATGLAPLLRRWGAMWGVDPDSGRLALARSRRTGWSVAGWIRARGPFLVTGCIDGPAGLARALGLLGASARLAFLDEARGEAGHWTDPAFPHAAETLFRRLMLEPSFRQRAGMHDGPDLGRALRNEEALAPRLAWAYLSLAVHRLRPSGAAEVLERATGRPVTPGQRAAVTEAGPSVTGLARGYVLALLYEERLLTRFGRNWFFERAAGRTLREWWEAEPDVTASEMASELGVDRMEATLILDRCRP